MTEATQGIAGRAPASGIAPQDRPTQVPDRGVRSHLAICVPTYRRPHLLARLLDDLATQTCRPGLLIIVDGEPRSGEVRKVVARRDGRVAPSVAYVPSVHANLPFQRYLGWRAARGAKWLLYFDDDLRVRQRSAVERLIRPLCSENGVAGVTAQILYPNRRAQASGSPITVRQAQRFGGGRRTRPGGLSPTGRRQLPKPSARDYDEVEWLRGGVMAFRMGALARESFCDDLFAMHHVGAGLGEDTVLARRVRPLGRFLLARHVEVEHPDAGATLAYPTDLFGYGYVWAYSRRMINEAHRGFGRPGLSDRLDLLWTYAGNIIVHTASALARPTRGRCLLALGYLRGALAGLITKPSAPRLTPDIDWHADAEESLSAASRSGAGGCLTSQGLRP